MSSLIENILLGGLSLESTDVEFEYEVYLHNPDLEYIASNSPHKVLQEQYGINIPKSDKNAVSGSIRTRKELFLVDKQMNHELTIKTCLEDGSDLESTVSISKEMYDQYTLLPDQGMRKLRCIIEVSDTIHLEVDVFETLAGDPIEWVKVDIEMNGDSRLTVDELKAIIPFDYEEVYIVTPDTKVNDPAMMERISVLYDKYFTIGNKHL